MQKTASSYRAQNKSAAAAAAAAADGGRCRSSSPRSRSQFTVSLRAFETFPHFETAFQLALMTAIT